MMETEERGESTEELDLSAEATAEELEWSESADEVEANSNDAEVQSFDSGSEHSDDVRVDSFQGEDDEGTVAPLCPIGAKVSALLFVASRPLSSEQLAEAANVKPETVERELRKLIERFQDEVHGFSLHNVAGAWQFRTHPGAGPSIQRLIPKSARRLSRAAAETLAVIAYRQPVQRAEIETIRGVDALPTLKTLMDARLVRIVGRGEAVGQPALYGTTEAFLEKFGLSDLTGLPSPRELAELMKEPGDVSDEPEFEPNQPEEFDVESEPDVTAAEQDADAHVNE